VTGSIKVRHLCILALTFVFCVALVGCGGGAVTKDNEAKIKEGDKLEDVEKVMGGKGTDLSEEQMKKIGIEAKGEGVKVVRWGDDNKYIVVTIMGGKVFAKVSKGL
jgi:hypothetical protein